MPKKITDFIILEMKKEKISRIWIGEFGVLAEAYDNYIHTIKPKRRRNHPLLRLESCMEAVRKDPRFVRLGVIRSILNSNRETNHPYYELIEKE